MVKDVDVLRLELADMLALGHEAGVTVAELSEKYGLTKRNVRNLIKSSVWFSGWHRVGHGVGRPGVSAATLRFIYSFMEQNVGRAPTYREIQDGCKFSSVSVAKYHVAQLVETGELCMADSTARAMTIPGATYTTPELPGWAKEGEQDE